MLLRLCKPAPRGVAMTPMTPMEEIQRKFASLPATPHAGASTTKRSKSTRKAQRRSSTRTRIEIETALRKKERKYSFLDKERKYSLLCYTAQQVKNYMLGNVGPPESTADR